MKLEIVGTTRNVCGTPLIGHALHCSIPRIRTDQSAKRRQVATSQEARAKFRGVTRGDCNAWHRARLIIPYIIGLRVEDGGMSALGALRWRGESRCYGQTTHCEGAAEDRGGDRYGT